MARKQKSRTEEQQSSSRTPQAVPEDINRTAMPVHEETAPTAPDTPNIPGLILYTSNGYITEQDIQSLCDEYIDRLPNDNNNIYKDPLRFTGLLLYIYRKLLYKYIILVNGIYDYSILDKIFTDIYMPLSYTYGVLPTIEGFTAFIQVDRNVIYEIYTGNTIARGYTVNINNYYIVKKWYDTLEAAAATFVTMANSIGTMFYLKARKGWSETANIHITATNDAPALDLEQIDALTAQDTPPQLPG